MLGICEQKNSKDHKIKMNFDSWTVHHHLELFQQQLTPFETLIIQFCQLAQQLKNPKNNDYNQALQTFHNQYYHKFLYHHILRTPECKNFIKCLQEFEQIKKPTKSQYVDLFQTLQTFQQKQLPGGHYNKIPFMFTDQAVEKWFYDEVGKPTEQRYEMFDADGIWTGHTNCPANSMSKSDEHLLQIELNEKHKQTLLKLQKDNVQMHKDLLTHLEDEDPYNSIQMAHLQRTHEHVHSLEKTYEQLREQHRNLENVHHNLENAHHNLGNAHHDLGNAHHDLENIFALNQQINHRQFDEINSLRYALEMKDRDLANKDRELYYLKNQRVRYT